MSSTTAGRPVPAGSTFGRVRRRFHLWRGGRPFWAGLYTMLGGVPIMYFPYANMQFGDLTIRMATTAGAGSLVIGVLMITLGLTMWYQPVTRVFAGVATLVLALVSLVVSNFGGLLVGFVLSVLGGGMSVSWAPARPGEEPEVATRDEERPDDVGVPAPHAPARRAETGTGTGTATGEHPEGERAR
ncbi:DUF6114 domain-containing protein [Streptomyces bohaiensis]|uniref:DUF6114 domain-containing protein n=1 Tax=Streptomyces bohaiensis TaxID=1431344 RepID=UPI003B8011D6